jgi:hypothetical protein
LKLLQLGLLVGASALLSFCKSSGGKPSLKEPVAASDDSVWGGRAFACSGAGLRDESIRFSKHNMELDGNSVSFNVVYASSQSKSLCEILAASQKEVAIFQFAGVFCLSCKDEAKYILSHLRTRKLTQRIQHYLVFVDPSDQKLEEDIAAFRREVSNNESVGLFEPGKKLFKKYSVDEQNNPKFGGAFVMNRFGDLYHHKPSEVLADLKTLLESAEQMLPAE